MDTMYPAVASKAEIMKEGNKKKMLLEEVEGN